jgi:hypothetical protein
MQQRRGVVYVGTVLKSPALCCEVGVKFMRTFAGGTISLQTKYIVSETVDKETSLVCMEATLLAAAPVPTPQGALEIWKYSTRPATQNYLKTSRGAPAASILQSGPISAPFLAVTKLTRTRHQDMSYGFLRAHLPKCILKLDALAPLLMYYFNFLCARAWKVNRFNLCQMSG